MTTVSLKAAVAGLAAAALLGCSLNNDVTQPRVAPGANAVPDFRLLDLNPTSPTAGQAISPRDHLGSVSAWYFGNSTCSYCRGQFGHLDRIQRELDETNPAPPIRIFGVNRFGEEAENDAACEGRDLPWLQETSEQDVWSDWGVLWLDLVILTPENEVHAVFNLQVNNLTAPTHRETLKALLIAAGR